MSKVMAAIIFASHIEYWTIIKWGKTITTYLVIIITKRGELRYSRGRCYNYRIIIIINFILLVVTNIIIIVWYYRKLGQVFLQSRISSLLQSRTFPITKWSILISTNGICCKVRLKSIRRMPKNSRYHVSEVPCFVNLKGYESLKRLICLLICAFMSIALPLLIWS